MHRVKLPPPGSLAPESPAHDEHAPSRAHRTYFSFAITCISRYMILRDRVFGLSKKGRLPAGIHERALRHSIVSAASRLDAVFVEPVSSPAHAAVLLCHGIGETVEQWFGAQQLLAANGVASFVFDYSGYGKSTGRPDWDQFEQDTVAAFKSLRELAPDLPASVLGFSLGSGVATATINRLDAHCLILCQAFTSFRGAAAAAWIPKGLTRLVPPIWHAQQPLADCRLPVLIVHGEKDRLFPPKMASELAAFCSPAAKVLLIPETSHNQPFRRPHLDYWGPIISWLGK
jgi:alpha-beta hydrolase superfamily lysophospholipase